MIVIVLFLCVYFPLVSYKLLLTLRHGNQDWSCCIVKVYGAYIQPGAFFSLYTPNSACYWYGYSSGADSCWNHCLSTVISHIFFCSMVKRCIVKESIQTIFAPLILEKNLVYGFFFPFHILFLFGAVVLSMYWDVISFILDSFEIDLPLTHWIILTRFKN